MPARSKENNYRDIPWEGTVINNIEELIKIIKSFIGYT